MSEKETVSKDATETAQKENRQDEPEVVKFSPEEEAVSFVVVGILILRLTSFVDTYVIVAVIVYPLYFSSSV